ncbi:FeoB-associated Cys-rich membrane protein [Vaginella massiliensis]|uniref:FeoB-associated Cys-rich membrane protein n=1 Tax=Vaginella massiliensis TaxID=1816680 RepID=UPI000B9A221D|nr:FeoB-associated Cys-rich membrane protein [Vaginella massiliensis]
MSNIYIQYGFIAIVFCFAIWYLIRLVKDTFKGKSGCSKGCGCDDVKSQLNTKGKE